MPKRRNLHAPCVEDTGTSWRVRIRYVDADGRRQVIKYPYPYDKHAAAEEPGSREEVFYRAAAASAAELHSLRVNRKPRAQVASENTLADWIQGYIDEAEAHTHKGWAQERVRLLWLLEQHSGFCQRRITDLTPEDFIGKPDSLARAMKREDGKPLAASTVRRTLATLSVVYNHARKTWGFKQVSNPVKELDLPAVSDSRNRTATAAEWRKVLGALAETAPATRAAIECLRWTAARRSEIVNLRWEDIDGFENAYCVATFNDTKNPKHNERRSRTVPFPAEAVKAVRRMLGKKKPPNSGRVFAVSADGITKAWVRACARAGVENLRLHDLRHTRITEIATVLPMLDAAAVSGHRDMRMLQRYYHPDAREIGKRLRAGKHKAKG